MGGVLLGLGLVAFAHAGAWQGVQARLSQQRIVKLREAVQAATPGAGPRAVERQVDLEIAERIIEVALAPESVGRRLPSALLFPGYAPARGLNEDPALRAAAWRRIDLSPAPITSLGSVERAALGRLRAAIVCLRDGEASSLRDVAWAVLDEVARTLDPIGRAEAPLPPKRPAGSGLGKAVEGLRAAVRPPRTPEDFRREAIERAEAEHHFVAEVQHASYRLLDDLLVRMKEAGELTVPPKSRPGPLRRLLREAGGAAQVVAALERRVVVPYEHGPYARRKRELFDRLVERVRGECEDNFTREPADPPPPPFKQD